MRLYRSKVDERRNPLRELAACVLSPNLMSVSVFFLFEKQRASRPALTG